MTGNSARGATAAGGIPVIDDWSALLDYVDASVADTVIVAENHPLSDSELRELAWGLDARNARLIVATALTATFGRRIEATPITGLPLLRVDFPAFGRSKLG